MKNGVICAYAINGDGTGILLEGDAVSKAIKDDTLAWVHIDGTSDEGRAWLQSEISYLDTIIIDALLADETRPRIVEFDKGVLAILRGVNLNDNASADDMISIRIWADENRIITVQLRPLKAVADIKSRMKSGKGPKNAGDFLIMLSGRLFDRMEPIFSDLDDRLDDIEEHLLEHADAQYRKNITNIRKQAIIFRRYVAPQKDVLAYLRTSDLEWLDQNHKRKLQENLDRVIRYVEDLDAIRERAQIVKDELANMLADKMNKNMYVLTIVAAIFLPLGFLTGLLGINVGGIPGAEDTRSFYIFCGILTALVAMQLVYFKWKKWF